MRYFLGILVVVCGFLGGIPYVNAQINLPPTIATLPLSTCITNNDSNVNLYVFSILLIAGTNYQIDLYSDNTCSTLINSFTDSSFSTRTTILPINLEPGFSVMLNTGPVIAGYRLYSYTSFDFPITPTSSTSTLSTTIVDLTPLVFPLGIIILIMSISMWYTIIRKK